MDKYYFSKLAKQIESSENGIENLDYKNLAEDLIENELSDLFSPKINRLFQQLRFFYIRNRSTCYHTVIIDQTNKKHNLYGSNVLN